MKKISLDDYIKLQKKLLDKFKMAYLEGRKEYGEDYPLSFAEIDWDEQFEVLMKS